LQHPTNKGSRLEFALSRANQVSFRLLARGSIHLDLRSRFQHGPIEELYGKHVTLLKGRDGNCFALLDGRPTLLGRQQAAVEKIIVSGYPLQ
jgi:hypothetical protein